MPKLSELVSSGGAAAGNRMRLSQAMTQPDFSAADLPHVFGGLGISPELGEAAGMGDWDRFAGGLPTAAADMFGSDEDLAASFLKRFPGARIVKDREGFNALELPNGKRFALDQPGVQGNEIATVIGNVAAFTPAGRAAGAVGGGLAAKAAVGGVASAATDAALQKVAGREEIDPVRTTLAGAGGAAGEVLSPIIGRAGDAIGKKLKSMFGSESGAIGAGRALAKQLGISNPSDDVAKALASRWDEIKAGADPKAIVAEAEIGLKLTQGQKTGSYGALRREEMLRASDSSAGQFMRDIDTQNTDAINAYLAKTRNALAGGEAAPTVGESFDKIGQQVRAEFGQQKAIVGDLYDRVSQQNAVVSRDAISSLPAKLKDAVNDFAVDKELTPSAARILELMKAKVNDLPEEVTGVTIKAIETERRRLNSAIDSAANGTDRAALTAIKRTFDDWYSNLADDAMLRGNTEVIDAMKSARDARAVLGQRFEARGPEDIGGKLIEKLVQGNATPEELAQAALGSSQVSKASGAQFIKRLKGALQPKEGPINPAWGEMKAAVLQQMTTGKNGEILGPQAIVGNLKQALRNRQSMMKELYTPEELSTLSRMTQTLDALVPKGMVGRSSGTTERAFAFIEQLMQGFPGGGYLIKAMQAPGQAATARNAYQPVRVAGLLDAATVGAGAAGGAASHR